MTHHAHDGTPIVGGRMPGEFEPHEATLMCWPARAGIWGTQLPQAHHDYAKIARTIGRFEPVWMVARPEDSETAAELCGPGVTVLELPIDDSWARDSGPVYVIDPDGIRRALDFTFNAWGEKFTPYADDARLVERWTTRRGEPRTEVGMVLEGGSVTVDGRGTLITTEECLLHPNRNPAMSRAQIEAYLAAALALEKIIWIPFGLALDDDTDGHVDNVVSFIGPGQILVQGCADPIEADHDRLRVNVRCLRDTLDATGEPLELVEIPVLPFTEIDAERVAVPYLNLYLGNGFAMVPVCGHAADDDMLGLIADELPGREVLAVPGAVLAFGGGGPHCITQQIPAI